MARSGDLQFAPVRHAILITCAFDNQAELGETLFNNKGNQPEAVEQMIRIVAVTLLLLLGACVSALAPPRNINNACSMKAERPDWFRALSRSEAKWGVPIHVQLATIWRESRFVGDARTPRKYFLGFIPAGRISSAYGYSQALDGTWDWYRDDTGRRFADRDDFDDATDFIGWYMNETLKRNGIPLNDAYRQYLAYHEGHTGYARGSYNSKSFLLRAANEVRNKAANYQAQLRTCS